MNIGFLGPAVATVLTVYGIETYTHKLLDREYYRELQQYLPFTVLKPCYRHSNRLLLHRLQQYLPFTVCDEGCEAAENRSDDEARTFLVPDRRKGKTKVIR